MTAYPAWTPASRPGIIPLHPLTFGTILGRSFAALRQNPRVLLGFALVVQTLAYLVVIVAIVAIGWATFSRLQTVTPGSEDYRALLAGSIAVTAISAFVLGLAASALGVIVQGVVVTEVSHAAVAERLPLRELWRQVRPVAWRLLGYSLLVAAALLVGFALVAAIVAGLALASPVLGIVVAVLAFLGVIVVVLWLSTKLLIAPAAIIMERATIRRAIARSWVLTRGRFWSTLGVVVIVQAIFGVLAQLVSIPFSIIASLLGSVIAPTGNATTAGVVTTVVSLVLTQIVTLLIQSVALVVQATASALIYIDCRMRREGLDLDLLAYVERRDAGETPLPDPYRQGIGRVFTRPSAPPPGYAPYPGPPYPAAPYPAGAYPAPPGSYQPGPYPPAPYAGYPPPVVPPAAPPAPSSEQANPSPTTWTAPGSDADRETP